MKNEKIHEVIIVGGGPAGLNAALILARCRRDIIIFDTGKPRNKRSHGMHGYLTRDGILPSDFLETGRRELEKYGVKITPEEIVTAVKEGLYFKLTNSEGKEYFSKKLLLATGLVDHVPPIEGMDKYYGSWVFHCPYCDGYEVRDKTLVVYGKEKRGYELAFSLKTWSNNISLVTDGDVTFTNEELELLDIHGIRVFHEKVLKLDGTDTNLEKVVFTNNKTLACDALFFCNGYHQHSDLAYQLHCNFSDKKVVVTGQYQQSGIPGLFVAGDADIDMHFVIVAAAEGAHAGAKINMELQFENRYAHLNKNKEEIVEITTRNCKIP